jgi:hypothetical protein
VKFHKDIIIGNETIYRKEIFVDIWNMQDIFQAEGGTG